jgi:hypothetical protein
MATRYTDDDIARMTPWQREEAQLRLVREFLARTAERRKRRDAQRAGRMGGLAAAAKRRVAGGR